MRENIKNTLGFIEKHEKIVFGIFIAIIAFSYYISYSIHSAPNTMGWGNAYSDLILSGKMPYRDFYYYLPPLNLLIDIILWKLSFGHLIIYVIFRIIERVFIILLMYNLLCKFAKPRYAMVGTIVGTMLMSAQSYDLIGDYNQTTALLLIILTSIYVKYIEIAKDSRETNKKQFKYLFLGGIVMGISFLLKQTVFAAEVIVFFIALTYFFIANKKKSYIKSLAVSLAGMIIPIGITSIFLAINNAFIPFIDQVYIKVDAKGSMLSIFTHFFVSFLKLKEIILLIYTIICFYFTRTKRLYDENIKIIFLIIANILFTTIFALLYGITKIENLSFGNRLYIFYILFVGIETIVFLAFKLLKKETKHRDNLIFYVLYAILLFGIIIANYINYKSNLTIFFALFLYNNLDKIITIVNLVGIVFTLYYIHRYKKTRDTDILRWIILLSGGISFSYNYGMHAGKGTIMYAGIAFMSAILVMCILSKGKHRFSVPKHLALMFCITITLICISSKLLIPYKWWGCDEISYEDERWNTINVPGMEGYKVTQSTKEMYEEMYKVIKSNSDENSVIYGFPNIRIFNVLLKNENMNHFIPVPFYDVCSDEYIKKDINLLKQNPPEIVVFADIKLAMEEHEYLFRDGRKLEQREFQEWLKRCVENNRYILIGQYNDLYVYKLNNGKEIEYTFFKDKVNDETIKDVITKATKMIL